MNSEYSKLKDKVLRFLSFRPRSRQEVQTYLSKKTEDASLINQIITELETARLIDDNKFAVWVIESRSRSRPRGARLLKQELQSKGIDSKTINDYLMTMNDENELAKQALEKKLKLWKHLPYREFFTKATRFLMTRGFNWSVIESVVKKSYNDTHVS